MTDGNWTGMRNSWNGGSCRTGFATPSGNRPSSDRSSTAGALSPSSRIWGMSAKYIKLRLPDGVCNPYLLIYDFRKKKEYRQEEILFQDKRIFAVWV